MLMRLVLDSHVLNMNTSCLTRSIFGAVSPFWGALWGVCSFFLASLAGSFCTFVNLSSLGFTFFFFSTGLHLGCASLLFLGLSRGSSSGFLVIIYLRLPLPRRLQIGNSRLAPSCRFFTFLALHYSPSGCGSLSIALRLFSLFLAPPMFRCSCFVSSGCTFLVVSTWRFSSHLLLLRPLFSRLRFASAAAVDIARHPF